MARTLGQIIARGQNTWLVRNYQGREPQTGTRKYLNQTIHGPLRDARGYSIWNCSSAKTAESLSRAFSSCSDALTLAPSAFPSYALFPTEPCVAQFEYPAKMSRRDGLQYQVILGRYHGEITRQKGSAQYCHYGIKPAHFHESWLCCGHSSSDEWSHVICPGQETYPAVCFAMVL